MLSRSCRAWVCVLVCVLIVLGLSAFGTEARAITVTSQQSSSSADAQSLSDSAVTTDLSPINVLLDLDWVDPAPVVPAAPSTASAGASLLTSHGPTSIDISADLHAFATWNPGPFSVDASSNVDLTIEFTLATAETMTWSSSGDVEFVLEHLPSGFQLRQELNPPGAFNWNCGSLSSNDCNYIIGNVWGGVPMPVGDYRLTLNSFAYQYDSSTGQGSCGISCGTMDGGLQLSFVSPVPVLSPVGGFVLTGLLAITGYRRMRASRD